MKNNILMELSSLWAILVESHPKVDYNDILRRIEKIQLMVFEDGETDGKKGEKEKQKR